MDSLVLPSAEYQCLLAFTVQSIREDNNGKQGRIGKGMSRVKHLSNCYRLWTHTTCFKIPLMSQCNSLLEQAVLACFAMQAEASTVCKKGRSSSSAWLYTLQAKTLPDHATSDAACSRMK